MRRQKSDGLVQFRDENGITTRVKTEDGWVTLTHEIWMHRDHPMLIPNGDYVWDYLFADELTAVIENRPCSCSYSGDWVILKLTQHDATIVRMFVG